MTAPPRTPYHALVLSFSSSPLSHPTRTLRPLLIGLIGGIASGKSTVARAFQKRGARVIDADTLAKDLLDLPDARRALAAAFGDVETAGRIDHAKLARAAFGSPETAARLNAIMHPHVTAGIHRQIAAWRAEGFDGPIVVDAALLLEAGMAKRFDELVFVDAPEGARRERARARGWDDGEIGRREGLQWPLEKKRSACRFTVQNGGSLEELERQVGDVFAALNR